MRAARTAAVYRATILENPYIPHEPHPRQQDALALWDEFDVGFGGAAGGGKTDLLAMEGLQWMGEPGCAVLYLRKTIAEFKKSDNLIPRLRDWLAGTPAKENRSENRWTFPTSGKPSTLEFGYLEHAGDEYKYKGARFDKVLVDQAEDFADENQLRYVASRIRRPAGSRIPSGVRLTFNPGGVGHEWLQQRYIPEEYDDLSASSVWIKEYLDERNKTQRAHFLFSTMRDNPSIDQEQYEETLWRLPPHIRKMLLDGDWSAGKAGEYFKREWFTVEDLRPKFKKRVRYWDLAATDDKQAAYTVGVRIGITISDQVCIDHVVRGHWTAGTRDDVILQTAKMDGVRTPQYIEQEPGSGGKAQIAYIRRKLMGFRVIAVRKRTAKEVEWGPLASWAEAEHVLLILADWNRAFMDELTNVPKGKYKDQTDAAAGGFKALGVGRRRGVRIRERRRR